MRTRTSWRNQDRLWKALTPPAPPKPEPEPIENLHRCYDCLNYPKGGRSRGTCKLLGEKVYGETRERSCWMARPERGGRVGGCRPS